MKKVGLVIKFPAEKYAYRIAFVAKVYYDALERYGFELYEENNKLKTGIKTLVIKK